MSIFFNYSKADGSYMPTMAGYVLLVAVLLAILIIGAALTGRGRKASAKQIAFSSVAIALGTVTSMIKIFEFPMGGSLTLFSMLFVTLVGYWYGTRAGITASVAYGILQLVLWPYIINPVQPIVDYVLAFGALGLSGVFHNSKNGLVKGYMHFCRDLFSLDRMHQTTDSPDFSGRFSIHSYITESTSEQKQVLLWSF